MPKTAVPKTALQERASLTRCYSMAWSVVRGGVLVAKAGAKAALATLLALCGGQLLAQTPAPTALPTGAQVVAGAATLQQSGAQLTVQQASDKLVTNWQSFNIGASATVRFNQPGTASVALNRVLSNDPSAIFGTLQSNGQVFLVNPSGVLFGASARVDVGGLVASSLQLADADFLAGRYRFGGPATSGAVGNLGRISAAQGGYLAFIAPRVSNTGSLSAPQGSVALGAGEQVSMDFAGDKLLRFSVDQGTVAALADNQGLIQASGGSVVLSARAADAVTRAVVNQGGVVDASSLVAKGGRIVLEGDDISLKAGSRTDATGASGGGTVLVGGDWQGSGTLRQATTVKMESGAGIDASATHNGDGGKVVLWSDIHNVNSVTTTSGTILAKGGDAGGDGGNVETSGHTLLVGASARVDTLAPEGKTGTWLLDPLDFTISAGSAPQSTSGIGATTLSTNLASTSVIIQTDGSTGGSGDIHVNAAITKGGATETTLTLKSHRDININSGANITATTGKLNLVLWTDYVNTSFSGRIRLTGTTINTNGGHVWMGGAAASGTAWNGLTVGSGVATTWSNNDSAISLTGGTSINTGVGNVYMSGLSWNSGANTGSSNYGVYLDNASVATSTGTITMNGALNGLYVNGAGLLLNAGAGNVAVTSGSGAINLSGTGTDAVGTGVGNRQAFVVSQTGSNTATVRSASGDITLTGTATFANTTSDDLTGLIIGASGAVAGAVNVVSQTGNISLIGSSTRESQWFQNGIRLAASNIANNIRIGFDGTNAYSGNITIQGNSLAQRFENTGTGSLAVQTSGNLTIQSSGAAFTQLRADAASPLSFGNDWNFGTTLSSFTLGKTTNTSALTLSNALSVAGPISIFGGDIALNANLTSTAAGAAILIDAKSDITTGDSAKTIQTNNGNITLNGDSDANNVGLLNLDYTTYTAGTGNITFRGATMNWVVGVGTSPTISSTTGAFVFESNAPAFNQAVDTGWFIFPTTLSGMQIGKATNTPNISVSTNALSVVGPISIFGGDIALNANLTSTAAGAVILAKGTGNVVQGNVRVMTNGGNVTYWADSDNNGSGGIQIQNNAQASAIDTRTNADRTATTNTTGGGTITLAGGLDDGGTNASIAGRTASDGRPDGFATNVSGTTTASAGVLLGTDTGFGQNTGIKLYSGSGDIVIHGRSTANINTLSLAVMAYQGLDINAGTNGNISLVGRSTAVAPTSAGTDLAAWRNASTQHGASTWRTHNGNITLVGSASGGTAENLGIAMDADTSTDRFSLIASGAGAISVTGTATGTASSGIRMRAVDVLAASGNISLIATSGNINAYGAEGYFIGAKSGVVNSSSSNILLRADSLTFGSATAISSTGTLTVEPSAASFSSALTWPITNLTTTGLTGLTLGKSGNTSGITIGSAQNINGFINVYGGNIAVNSAIAAAGNILLQGDTGSFLTQNSVGVNIAADVSTSNNGNITINGRGGSGTGYNFTHGVQIANLVSAGGTGAVNITGYGGLAVNGSTAQDHGIVITTASGQVKSSGGNVTLAGYAGGAGTGGANQGLAIVNGAEVSAAGAGSVSLTGTGGVTAATGNLGVIILNGSKIFTAGGAIGITGNAGTTGGLNNYGVIMQTSTIGSASSGAITLNGSGSGTGTGSEGIDLSSTMVLGGAGYAGNMTLNANSLSVAATTVTSTGALTVQPISNSFSSAMSWPLSGLTLTSGLTGLTLGKTTNTADITVSSAQSIAGPISIYGGAINLNANLSTTAGGAVSVIGSDITQAAGVQISKTGADANLLFRSTGAIKLNSGAGITSSSGKLNVTLQANSADVFTGGVPTTDGYIWLASNGVLNGPGATITSNGGDITLSGGQDMTTGYAVGRSTGNSNGITLDAATLSSGGGDIWMRGYGMAAGSTGVSFATSEGSNGANTDGIRAYGPVNVNAGVGRLNMTGVARAVVGSSSNGIELSQGGGSAVYTSANTGAAINMTGTSNGTAMSNGYGLYTHDRSTISATSGGNITLIGRADKHDGLSVLAGSAVLASGGTISLQGSALSGTAVNITGNVGQKAGSVVTASNAAIQVQATTYTGNLGNMTVASAVANTSGDMLFTATGRTILNSGASIAAGNGNVVFNTARFTNSAGASAVTASGTGKAWQVWSSNASPFSGGTPDARGGLVYDFKQYGATYGSSTVLGTGKGMLYTYAPSALTASLTGAVTRAYDGGATATLAAGNYAVGGTVDSDVVTLNNPTSGTYTTAGTAAAIKDVGTGKTVQATGVAIASAVNGSATVYGYTLGSSTASGSVGAITAKTVTLSGSKTYDGNTTLGAGTVTMGTGVGSETLTYSAATVNDANVATASKFISAITLGNGSNGGLASNYAIPTLNNANAAVTINTASLTLAGTRVYDGSTAFAGSSLTASGVAGQTFALIGAGSTGNLASKHVQTSQALSSLTGLSLGTSGNGGVASNYSALSTSGSSVSVTAKALTLTGFAANATKVYDAGTTATISNAGSLSGLIGGDAVTVSNTGATYADKNVGTGKTVTLNGISLGSTDAGNYSIAASTTTTADITRANLLVTGLTATARVYDGGTVAALGGTAAVTALLSDVVTLGGTAAGSFADKNVGTSKAVTVSGNTLGGADAGNYTLVQQTGLAANITGKALTLAASRVYDGTTTLGTVTLGGLVGLETLNYSAATASDAHVATLGKYVNAITLADGSNGGVVSNYLLPGLTAASASNAVSINAATLTPTISNTGVTKVYDGTTNAPASFAPTYTFSGLVTGDTAATLTKTGADYNFKDVATGSLVTVSGLVIAGVTGNKGSQATDYVLSAASQTVGATITPAALTVRANNDADLFSQQDSRSGSNYQGVGYTGLVGGETSAVLGGTLAVLRDNFGTNGAAAYANVLTPSGLTSSNYAITFAKGNYTVVGADQLLLAVTSQSLTYGAAPTYTVNGAKYLASDLTTISTPTVTANGGNSFTVDGVTFTLAAAGTSNSTAGKTVVGNYQLGGTVTAGSSANFSNTLNANGALQVNQAGLTASASGVSKTYDGNTSMTGVSLGLMGKEAADLVTVNGTGAFSSADVSRIGGVVQSDKSYTISNLALGGTDGGNYFLSGGSSLSGSNGRIDPKLLTATWTAQNKTYDGTTAAVATVASDSRVAGDTLSYSNTAVFDTKNFGTGKTVSISGITLGGAQAGNYDLAATTGSTTANIDRANLVLAAVSDTKTYDAGVASGGVVSITGKAASDSVVVTQQFASKNALGVGGSTLQVVSGYTIRDGSNADMSANYTVTASGTANGTVNKADITVSASGGISKTYDGNTTMTGVALAMTGNLDGANLTVSGTGAFSDANAGIGNRSYTLGGLTLSGSEAGNYALAGGATSFTGTNGTINQRTVTLTASKTYDGTNVLDTFVTLGNLVSGQALTYTGATANNKNVGAGNYVSAITLADGTGGVASNYQLPTLNAANAATTIGQASLTVTAGTSTKEYDRTTSASGSAVVAALAGAGAGDVVNAAATQSYLNANAGTGKTVRASGLTLQDASNADMTGNYSISYVDDSTGVITAKAVTLTAGTISKIYDGLTSYSVQAGDLSTLSAGLIGSDAVTAATFSFSDKNAGTANKTVTLDAAAVSDGNGGANYAVTLVGNSISTINKASGTVTVTANSDPGKVYNGAAQPVSGFTASGLVNGETASVLSGVTAGVSGTNAGSYTSTASGTDGNYNLTFVDGSLVIAKAAITVTPDTQTRVYGQANPAFSQTLTGFVNGETASNAGVTGTASGSSAASTNTPVGTAAISGGTGSLAANNYAFSTANGTLTITPAPLTVVLVGSVGKVYDGNTGAPLAASNYLLSGWVVGEGAGVTQTAGLFADKNAGNAKNVSVMLAGADFSANSGTLLSNYTLPTSAAGAVGQITPASLSAVTGLTASGKVYDGNTTATLDSSGAAFTGKVAGDVLALATASGNFGDKNVGAGKTVNVTGLSLGGADAGNYRLATNSASTTASIGRLASVTWVGGARGNWFDPANWAGGAVPDRANVSQVLIPAGVTITFGDTVVAPAEGGAVQIDRLGSLGSLDITAGTLNVGTGGVELARLAQSGGMMTSAADLRVGTLSQSGGSTAVQGALTVTEDFEQGRNGSITVRGSVDITDARGGTVLGNLSGGGPLTVRSLDGDIRQAAGSTLVAQGSALFNARTASGLPADVILAEAANDFAGPVDINARNAELTDRNGLALGRFTVTGNLALNSTGNLDLGQGSVGGRLLARSGGGDVTQIGALEVSEGTDIAAGAGRINLGRADNRLGGQVQLAASGGVTVLGAASAAANAAANAATQALTQTAAARGGATGSTGSPGGVSGAMAEIESTRPIGVSMGGASDTGVLQGRVLFALADTTGRSVEYEAELVGTTLRIKARSPDADVAASSAPRARVIDAALRALETQLALPRSRVAVAYMAF